MKSLILKYNWLCLALVCCAIFVACEPAEVATKEKAIAFKNGQVRAIAEEEANARLFAYRIAEGAEMEWLYGDADEGAYAQLTDVNLERSKAKFVIDDNGTKYWTDATYNFFTIYSPSKFDKEPTFNTETKTFTFPYAIDDVTSSDNEIWAAARLNESHLASETNPIQFEFNHILSKINFRIKKHSSNNDNKIIVTKVSISNVYTSGVYNLDVVKKSEKWVRNLDENGEVVDECPPLEFTPGASNSQIQPAGTLVLGGDGFLTIPQTVGVNTMKIVIAYDYYDEIEGITPTYSKEVEAYLPVSVVKEWEVGKNYIYNLLLSAETNDIFFTTPTISDWGTSPVGSIIIQ